MSGFIHYSTSSSFHGTKEKVAQLTPVEGMKHSKPSILLCPCHHICLVLIHPSLCFTCIPYTFNLPIGKKGIKEHQPLYLGVF